MSDEKNPKGYNVDNLTLFIGGRPIIGLSPGKPCARCGDRNWGNSYGGDLCPFCEGIKELEAKRSEALKTIAHDLTQLWLRAKKEGMKVSTFLQPNGEVIVTFLIPEDSRLGILPLAVRVGWPND